MSKDLINIVHALIKRVDELTAEVKTLRAENAALLDENKGLKLKVEEQKRIIDEQNRVIYGSKTERFIPLANAAGQVPILFALEEIGNIEVKGVTTVGEKQKPAPVKKMYVRPGRNPFPAHLERNTITQEPQMDLTGYVQIGQDVTERLDYQPSKLTVNRYVYPKYIQIDEQTRVRHIVQAESVQGPIEKGIPEAGLLAAIAVDKFLYHMPIDRQLKRFAYLGVELAAGTVNGWMDSIHVMLAPLMDALKTEVLSGPVLQADESHIRVLDSDKKGKTHRGWMWVYRHPQKRLVLFDYRRGRDKSGPIEMLEDYRGFLQVDGYTCYEDARVGGREDITLVHCHAHSRRYFEKALPYDPVRANHYMTEIQKVYHIEREIKEQQLNDKQIVEVRETRALPILKELKQWLIANASQVLPDSPIGKAIHYALSRWDKLLTYTHYTFIPIDNNGIESLIRSLALGRKNYLFAGSHHGAERIALMYSLMACCKEYSVDPYEYLKDVISRISTHKQKNIKELLPHHWSRADKSAIRQSPEHTAIKYA
ncbi:Transposase [Arachidicoccus rhizosphaerae]|uniref:Transposase n=1 Tax=Arachidicoccus rhizosphaerae TaxID=551991 RepID=A0A1H4CNA0_9BACT|nr:IS66 family transposase [Arachidicoccus rhizosphaerae]SEA04631.1 Transposase [Arachidicoccus rhizosphaerae]SEA34827.1 Transposase [Arachidicoccus rhizosphaerae]SEA61925.1 Transposase [Arachidicoccus rhizosphaerae]